VPKAIDFGLAKATSGMQLTEHTLFTALGQVAGTPLYIAPEHAAVSIRCIRTRLGARIVVGSYPLLVRLPAT